MAFGTVDEILDLAIENEEDAAVFYTQLAGRVAGGHMEEVFLEFAEEEQGHKAKLQKIKRGEQILLTRERVMDLKIGDHLESVQLSAELDYQQALIVAMKAEKAAFKLYQTLATATTDATLRAVLLGLAQEEAKHKLRFEIEYDENILKDN